MTCTARPLFILLAAAAAAVAAAPAWAQPPAVADATDPRRVPLSLSLDAHVPFHLDDDYRLFSRDRGDGGGGVSAVLDVVRMGRGVLAAGIGVHGDSNRADWGGDAPSTDGFTTRQQEAHLQLTTLSATALLRWPVRWWLEPHVRLAVDSTWSKLTVTMNQGSALDDKAWSPGASAGAGLRIRSAAMTTSLRGGRLGLAAALMIEGGFHLGSPLSFSLTPTRPADDKLAGDQIPGPAVPVGDLGRSHPYLRISLALLI